MIRINLLPYREKAKKENLQRQIFIIAGSLVIFLLILVSVQFYVSMVNSSLEKKIKEAEAKLVVLDKKVGDIEGYKKNKKELEQKLGVINSLEGNRLFPVRMLDEIRLILPEKEAWLEKLTQTGKDLRIEGVARDNGTVARLMKNMEKLTFVKSVDLVVTKERDVAGVKLQQFVLTCVLDRGI
jgi:type IV pilus assembly protein PilN